MHPEDSFDHSQPPGLRKGRLAHTLIARALDRGYTQCPSREQALDLIRPEFEDLWGPMRQSATHEAMTSMAQYFRFFGPSPGLLFLGSEVEIPGARLDALFAYPAGVLAADEIKTGRSLGAYELAKFEEQVYSQVECAVRAFGDSFAGIRALILSRPHDSYLLDRSGDCIPLMCEPAWQEPEA